MNLASSEANKTPTNKIFFHLIYTDLRGHQLIGLIKLAKFRSFAAQNVHFFLNIISNNLGSMYYLGSFVKKQIILGVLMPVSWELGLQLKINRELEFGS